LKAIVGQLYSRFLAEIHRAGIVVGRRFQFCIAVLSIALQAADLCVGGWGHRHEHFGIDDSENAALADSCGHECHHHDHDGLTDESDGQIPADSHDDCSLCRHFSQPVAPVAVELPAVACEHVAPLFARLISTEGISAEIRHPARGPPAFVA
jgi:hypothetical protein